MNQTFTDPNYYGSGPSDKPAHGTSHFSLVFGGEAISITASINLHFGSKVKGKRTGIIFNNHMDDFSLPGEYNSFNLPPAKENFIQPGKRPQSSMSPIILLRNGKFYFTAGGSGGSKIPTGILNTLFRYIFLNKSLEESIAEPRVHHQLLPMILKYQTGFDEEIAQGLKDKGHKIKKISYRMIGTCHAIAKENGRLIAKSDNRQPGGTPAGF